MKRLLGILLTLALGITGLASPVWAEKGSEKIELFGDLNQDSKVDAADALLALQHSVALTILSSEALRAGDLNLDGAVDSSDALQILQLSVSLINTTDAERNQNAVLHPGDRVLFVGDSVTDANRDRDNPDDLAQGYVGHLQTAMMLEYSEPDLGLTLINRGYNGTRTHDWLSLIDATLEEAQADVVSVALGINDTWRRYDQNIPCTAEEYGDNLRVILTAIQKTSAKIIVISPFALAGSTVDITGWYEEDLNAKIDMCRHLAEEFDAIYIPMSELFYEKYGGDPSYTWDGIHPNARGAAVMAEEWASRVSYFRPIN